MGLKLDDLEKQGFRLQVDPKTGQGVLLKADPPPHPDPPDPTDPTPDTIGLTVSDRDLKAKLRLARVKVREVKADLAEANEAAAANVGPDAYQPLAWIIYLAAAVTMGGGSIVLTGLAVFIIVGVLGSCVGLW